MRDSNKSKLTLSVRSEPGVREKRLYNMRLVQIQGEFIP